MALDNAQFISELSITDPPGTDPLSEGDDQIRTSKRTQLQSFPNVDKAVTTTADELNDVAFQAASNAFLATNTFAAGTTFNAGTTMNADLTMAAPAATLRRLFFSADGVSRWNIAKDAGDNLIVQRFNAAGSFQDEPWAIDEANGSVAFANEIRGTFGNANFPGISFSAASNFGMYSDGSALSFATLGVQRLRMVSGQMQQGNDGTPAAPAWTWTLSTTLGLYRIGTTEFGLSANSALRMSVTGRGINMVTLPTSDVGLISGDLFVSSNFIAIVP